MPDERTGRLNAIRSQGTGRAVVFLHGYTGTRDDTWDRFPGLLGAHLQGWDIFTLGYATTMLPDIVGIWSADPDLPILATLLRTELMIEPLRSYASLVLIAHSMGGLVVQRALIDDQQVAKRARHVILFGTPSAGLRKAWWGQFWKRQLRNMARDSDFITRLRREWNARFAPTPPFGFLVVAGASDQFVTPDSSLDPFDRQFHRVVPGNHLEIVKPQDATAMGLRVVLAAVSDQVPTPVETSAPLTLAAERPTADVATVVAELEQTATRMSEREVVQAALALERAGERAKAMALLERHQALGTDVQGTLAGRVKRLWFETDDPSHAQRALDLYQHALEQALARFKAAGDARERIKAQEQIYYHAINVAFLEFVLDSRAERAAATARLAAEHAAAVPENVWSVATLAEARLYLGDTRGAVDLYRKTLGLGGEPWQYASAGLQASRVAAKLGDQALAEELETLFTPGARQVNRIFVSYSHRDREWADRLQTMAKPYLRHAEAELDLWVDTKLQAGDRWRSEIALALHQAGVVVALVSADFLASEFVWQHEMPEILNAARERKLRLLWVYLSPAGWEETELRHFQATHDTRNPLTALARAEQDEILKRVAQEIKCAALGATDPFVARATTGSV